MAKPIAVLYLPDKYSFGGGVRMDYGALMHELNGYSSEDHVIISPYLEYLWFVFPDYDIETPRLEVFNSDKMEPSDIEELQAKVIAGLSKTKQQQETATNVH